jgi:hypothetical protein
MLSSRSITSPAIPIWRGFLLAVSDYPVSELTTVNLALPRGRTTTRNGYSADRSGSGSRALTSPETTSIMPALFRPVTVTGWLACMQCFTFAKSLARICNSMVPYAHHAGRPHPVKVMTKGHRRFRTTIPPGVDTKDAAGFHGPSLDREYRRLHGCGRQTHSKHLGQMSTTRFKDFWR